MLDTDTYKKIYDLLDSANPVPYDCGILCDSICCSDATFDDDDSYIYLFPGEKEYLEHAGSTMPITEQRRDEHDIPLSWGEYVYIGHCRGKDMCERCTRPIQCRTFPLQPYISKSGQLEMVLCFTDTPYHCPFVDGSVGVSADFREAALKAWEILIEDEAIRDLVVSDSRKRR
ncbi:MAG: hypothetical protein K6E49_02220 [Lachnospiraceae bacterium]|nr:hypothetical protein [Lachnospiraceae bacterium]